MTPQLHTSLSPSYSPRSTYGATQYGVQTCVKHLRGLVLYQEAKVDDLEDRGLDRVLGHEEEVIRLHVAQEGWSRPPLRAC